MSIYYQWNDEQNYATLPFTLVVFGASVRPQVSHWEFGELMRIVQVWLGLS